MDEEQQIDDSQMQYWQQLGQQEMENEDTYQTAGGNSENTERTKGTNEHVRRVQVPELRGYSHGGQTAVRRTCHYRQ